MRNLESIHPLIYHGPIHSCAPADERGFPTRERGTFERKGITSPYTHAHTNPHTSYHFQHYQPSAQL